MNLSHAQKSPRHVVVRLSQVVWLAFACAVTLLAPRLAFADVPGRVGRIAYIEGDVQAYSETDPTWKVAYLNQPITSRNSVFVGDAGRAEISVGSTTIAMDAGSQVDIQQLDDNTLDANVVRGRVSMRVRRLDANDAYNVAVPGADFALLRPGRYRIDALQSSGGITVFEGQASVQGDRGERLVDAGNGLRVAFNATDANAAPELLAAAPVAVPLDDWVLARENRFRNSQAERYVSPNMTGYEDLDANGRWSNEEDLGPVWYPTTHVRADWAPYRYGRWAYVAPWGYTWIDDAPWGFAPFHYGRWIQVGNRWGWTPGAYVARPAYAPALVGFYGGDNFSASFSVGAGPAVGWYPLAPWQRYSPHYTRNATYVNQVNNITIVNAPRRFGGGDGGRDWNRDHGGTLAPRDAFTSQRSISRVVVAAPRDSFDRARPIEVANLPRPVQVPGAVRRGPDSDRGDPRPAFRSPREFANRQNPAEARAAEQGGRPVAPGFNPPGDRGQPDFRRPDDRRPTAGSEAGRAVPPVQPQGQEPRGTLGADRPGRPQVPQGAPAGEGRGFEQPRFTPRTQPQIRNDGEQRVDQRQQPAPFDQQRALERQNREQRNVQQPPQGQSPQVVEQRTQGFERQQLERQQQVERQQAERQNADRQNAERQNADRQNADRQNAERFNAERQNAERQQQAGRQQQQQMIERQQQVERQQQAGRQQMERQQMERQQVERQQVERQQVERQQQAGRQQMERQQMERQQVERQQVERQQVERQQRAAPAAPVAVPAPAPVAPRPQPQPQPAPTAERPGGPRELNRDR